MQNRGKTGLFYGMKNRKELVRILIKEQVIMQEISLYFVHLLVTLEGTKSCRIWEVALEAKLICLDFEVSSQANLTREEAATNNSFSVPLPKNNFLRISITGPQVNLPESISNVKVITTSELILVKG